tara:strand:+ start:302 stop:553 length:252 start_codon:yes stop_codon:yes gene_type:complete
MKVDALQCLSCKDILYARARHDLRPCTCGAIYVSASTAHATPVEVEVDVTLSELYDDWNLRRDEFGLITTKFQRHRGWKLSEL